MPRLWCQSALVLKLEKSTSSQGEQRMPFLPFPPIGLFLPTYSLPSRTAVGTLSGPSHLNFHQWEELDGEEEKGLESVPSVRFCWAQESPAGQSTPTPKGPEVERGTLGFGTLLHFPWRIKRLPGGQGPIKHITYLIQQCCLYCKARTISGL